MRAVFGLLLVMLGLAMAVIWMPEHHGERQLAVATDIATKGVQRSGERDAVAADRAGRTFSPHMPLLASVEPQGTRLPHTASIARVVSPEPVTRPVSPGSSIVTASLPTASVVDAVAVPVRRPAEPSLGRAAGVSEMSRDELVRNIQRELKRVGCYWGEVDGDWGTGSRRAMTTFTERVNALLPVDQPDFILLALVRGHTGAGCGGATVAQGRRSFERKAAAQPTNPEQGPQPVAGGWSTNVVAAAPSRAFEPAAATVGPAVPALAAAAVAVVAAQSQLSVQPLPGRMAVGGPQNGSGSAYVTNPPDRSPAQSAVRGATEDLAPAARTPVRDRARRAASARRSGPSAPYAYRYYPVPPASVYRPAPPRYYASAPPRRGGRNWTATFFGNHP